MGRIAAFVKRLGVLSLVCSAASAKAYLATITTCIEKFPGLQGMLEEEQGGRYDSEVNAPDLANALSVSCWELALLRNHYDPELRRLATSMPKKVSLLRPQPFTIPDRVVKGMKNRRRVPLLKSAYVSDLEALLRSLTRK